MASGLVVTDREPGQDTVSLWIDGVTSETLLTLKNLSSTIVDAFWIDYEGARKKFARLRPGATWSQSTYNTHPWLLKSQSGTVLAIYCGESASLVVKPDTSVTVASTNPEDDEYQHEEWGTYRECDRVQGISIWAFDCVSTAAVQTARHVLSRMLQDTPAPIMQRLQDGKARVAIIGRRQVTTDIPEHSFMKSSGQPDERDVDTTARGLGGTKTVPTCSCGEENLLRDADKGYSQENILIHEFGHSVMEIGLDENEYQVVQALYEAARSSGVYDVGCYMMENAAEYWAEACQSWFDATLREDVNTGLNTRAKIKQHDPELANMLCQVFGDGVWRYWHDCPGKWGNKPKVPQVTHVEAVSNTSRPADGVPAHEFVPLYSEDMHRVSSSMQNTENNRLNNIGCWHTLTACFAFTWFRKSREHKLL